MAKDKSADQVAADQAAADQAAADQAAADQLLLDQLAAEKVEAFVLRDCGFGQAGDVVTVSKAEAETGGQHGMLDAHPNAVKAAKLAKK